MAMTKEEFLEGVREGAAAFRTDGDMHAFVEEGEEVADDLCEHDPKLADLVREVCGAFRRLGLHLMKKTEA